MPLEMAEVAVDGDEELGPDERDHQPQLLLRAVAGDMDEARGAVVVDYAGIAALQVVDDAVDGFFVARDDTRAEQNGIAWINLGELVVVDRRA
jgi:hypothetical protein